MSGEKINKNRNLKIVTVRIPGASVLDQEPSLLFTAGQVEEVLLDVKIQPLPFGAEWLLGFCVWRQQLLPVVNTARLYGLQSTSSDEAFRYLVIRTALPAAQKKMGRDQEKSIFRCVLRVSDLITTGEIPEQCKPLSVHQTDIKASLARGIFEHKDGLLIVPDLVPVTCSDAEPDTVRGSAA